MPTTPHDRPIPLFSWLVLSAVFALLIGLTSWSWRQWDQAWIQPANTLFPFVEEDAAANDALPWQYPVFRSNDTYEWVYMADELSRDNQNALRHRFNEGTVDGRPSAWSSALPRVLYWGGAQMARMYDWPAIRGIHHLAQWLGAPSQLIIIALSSLLLLRTANLATSCTFALLYFFAPAINWDFAYSRLDHDIFFQLSIILQALSLYYLFTPSRQFPNRWAVLGGLGAGLGWWIGSTVQAAIGMLIVLACLSNRFHKSLNTSPLYVNPWLIWGVSASLGIISFGLIDQRWPYGASINTLHPIFILAQMGAALVCAIGLRPTTRSRVCYLALGFLLGLSPLAWIAIYGADAHVWFDPLQHRFHQVIVEMKSPLSNGLWSSQQSISLALIGIVALLLTNWRIASSRALGVLLTGLTLLAIYQTRWIGLAATIAALTLSLSIRNQNPAPTPLWRTKLTQGACFGLVLLFAISWAQHWRTVGHAPNKTQIVDFYVQVAARDINLNIDAYSEGQPARAIIPLSFAANSTLFPEIFPLGTFYWENKDGLAAACAFYASTDHTMAERIIREHNIEYIAVSRLQLGLPFAALASEITHGSAAPRLESTLAWQLSFGQNIPDWCEELAYYGSIDPRTFSARIYRVTPE